jgi:hypothetical protein
MSQSKQWQLTGVNKVCSKVNILRQDLATKILQCVPLAVKITILQALRSPINAVDFQTASSEGRGYHEAKQIWVLLTRGRLEGPIGVEADEWRNSSPVNGSTVAQKQLAEAGEKPRTEVSRFDSFHAKLPLQYQMEVRTFETEQTVHLRQPPNRRGTVDSVFGNVGWVLHHGAAPRKRRARDHSQNSEQQEAAYGELLILARFQTMQAERQIRTAQRRRSWFVSYHHET